MARADDLVVRGWADELEISGFDFYQKGGDV